MRKMRKYIAATLACSLLLSLSGQAESVDAAKKKPYLNKKKITLSVGKKKTLKVKGTKKKIQWKSKNKKIATVTRKGVVKAKKKGITYIQAKVKKTSYILKCKVVVTKTKKTDTATPVPSDATQTPTSIPGLVATADPVDRETGVPGTTPDVTSEPTPEPTPEISSTAPPVLSVSSGSYAEQFELTMSCAPGSTIYYTLDGSIPLSKEEMISNFPEKLDTKIYTEPIQVVNRDGEDALLATKENTDLFYDPALDSNGEVFYPANEHLPKATVIRAMVVDAEGNKSDVVTRVYFVGKDLQQTYPNAAVVSVVTDPSNLLDEETGIYRYGNWNNSGDAWERPAEVTYIDADGTIPFETTMGIRIHGGYSRGWAQKSIRLYFRDELGGLKNLKYPLIPGATNADGSISKKFKHLILRNGGNDYKYTKMQDVWTQNLVSDRAVATQSARPAVLFLNGEYWGLYNVTERYSDNYVENEFGVKKENVVMIKNGELDEGEDEDYSLYQQLRNLSKLDMSKDENYAKFTGMVDETNYIDYFATEIYIGNKDWPNNNMQLWRSRENDGSTYGDTKWRYMLFDTEYSMKIYGHDVGNAIENAKNDSLFNAVCANATFQEKLATALMELANENFNPDTALPELEQLTTVYQPLLYQSNLRWFGAEDVRLTTRLAEIEEFIHGRKAEIQTYIKDSFGLEVE